MELKGGGGAPPPGQQTKMSGTISPRDRLQLWVNTFLLKQKENSGSVTATFRDMGVDKLLLVSRERKLSIHLHSGGVLFTSKFRNSSGCFNCQPLLRRESLPTHLC